MIKHCTSSIYIFNKAEAEWKLLLLLHKKFNRWLIPGGHVEQNENSVEAVLREAKEETNLTPRLVSYIHKSLGSTDTKWLLPPEYLFEHPVPAWNNEAAHFHLDSIYVGLVESDKVRHRSSESDAIRWFNEKEVQENSTIFPTAKNIAVNLFEKLEAGVQFSYEQKV